MHLRPSKTLETASERTGAGREVLRRNRKEIAAFEDDFSGIRPFGNATTGVPVSKRGYRRASVSSQKLTGSSADFPGGTESKCKQGVARCMSAVGFDSRETLDRPVTGDSRGPCLVTTSKQAQEPKQTHKGRHRLDYFPETGDFRLGSILGERQPSANGQFSNCHGRVGLCQLTGRFTANV